MHKLKSEWLIPEYKYVSNGFYHNFVRESEITEFRLTAKQTEFPIFLCSLTYGFEKSDKLYINGSIY